MDRKTIESEADIAEGVRALRQKCQCMRRIHRLVGNPPLRRLTSGFPGLVRIVVGQQLSIASASAIWERVEAGIVPFEPERVLSLDDEYLRALGLSRPKVATIRSLATALARGDVDIDALNEAEDEEIHRVLTGLRGFGPWSADIYIMFCLGRRDGFACGDLALQEAVRLVLGLNRRPNGAELFQIAERWRPWRSVAAGLLWSHHAAAKKVTSALPA